MAAAMVASVSWCGRGWMLMVLLPLGAPWIAAGASGAVGGWSILVPGRSLRDHELSRRWLWEPAPERAPGERQYPALAGRARARAAVAGERRVRVDERSRR